MSNDDQIGSRRAPRQGVGGSPMGSGLTIALAAVALIAGFFILQDLNGDAGSSSGNTNTEVSGGNGDTDADGTPAISVGVTTLVEPEPVPTDPPRTTTGATVLVANANSVGGSAGQMTSALEFAGYTMAVPLNASGANIEQSIVYYAESVAGAKAVAESVALDLGGLDVLTLPTDASVVDGDIGDVGVIVMLGDAQAGQTLSDLSGSSESAGTPAAPDPSPGDAATEPASDAEPAADTEG